MIILIFLTSHFKSSRYKQLNKYNLVIPLIISRVKPMPMFEEIKEIRDLLNSEGPILRLLKKTDTSPPEHDLYIECRCKGKPSRIICKISAETLDLYLKGRLRTKELFLIRSDEEFIVRTAKNYNKKRFGSKFSNDCIDNLSCGNYYYTDLSPDLKGNADSSEVMRFVKTYW
jgi:hypothetical protein